jgi:hypothetical protein
MIPHSLLGDEIFGKKLPRQRCCRAEDRGLRERVTACRKRVRRNRAMHKSARVRNQSDEIFSEADSAMSRSRRYTQEYSLAVGERLVVEQEVGIT